MRRSIRAPQLTLELTFRLLAYGKYFSELNEMIVSEHY